MRMMPMRLGTHCPKENQDGSGGGGQGNKNNYYGRGNLLRCSS